MNSKKSCIRLILIPNSCENLSKSEAYLKINTDPFLGQYGNGYIWLWNKICKSEGICIIFSLAGMSGINEGEDILKSLAGKKLRYKEMS